MMTLTGLPVISCPILGCGAISGGTLSRSVGTGIGVAAGVWKGAPLGESCEVISHAEAKAPTTNSEIIKSFARLALTLNP